MCLPFMRGFLSDLKPEFGAYKKKHHFTCWNIRGDCLMSVFVRDVVNSIWLVPTQPIQVNAAISESTKPQFIDYIKKLLIKTFDSKSLLHFQCISSVCESRPLTLW